MPPYSLPPQRGLLAQYPLISFFVMAYAFSWIAWSPWVLSEDGAGLLPYKLSGATTGLLNAAAILVGPTLSAFIMTGITEGRAGIRRLLRRIVLWRVGLRWYLVPSSASLWSWRLARSSCRGARVAAIARA